MKYEVAVCLKTAMILVWVNGPFVGGKHDNQIFREGLCQLLFDDEAVEADQGYGGDNKLKTPDMGDHSLDRKMKANAQAQHEAVNG